MLRNDRKNMTKILVVDDEHVARLAVVGFLRAEGIDVSEAIDCCEGEQRFRDERPDIAVLDYFLPDGNAMDLLERFQKIDASVPVVILTGHASIGLAVQAIKQGAAHFLTKPVEYPAMLVILNRILDAERVRRRDRVRHSVRKRAEIDPFVGKSRAIQELGRQAARVATSDSPVLIQGETGTGKGVLAQWLHNQGARSEEAFVDLNCAGLTKEFLETELFGHTRGAFTGANSQKAGLLEMAHRGTVFLDEMGDMDLRIQPKLLKALEENRFRRLGDVKDRQVDVRLIAATHYDLKRRVREQQFRSDLYFRVSTLPLVVPALRERSEDIPELAARLVDELASKVGRAGVRFSDDAIATLQRYHWPGNIRELRNVLERALLLRDVEVLEADDLWLEPDEPQSRSAAQSLVDVEIQHIVSILGSQNGHVEKAAKILGIPRSSLYEKIKKYGIERSKASEPNLADASADHNSHLAVS